jgi:hypothetical protein
MNSDGAAPKRDWHVSELWRSSPGELPLKVDAAGSNKHGEAVSQLTCVKIFVSKAAIHIPILPALLLVRLPLSAFRGRSPFWSGSSSLESCPALELQFGARFAHFNASRRSNRRNALGKLC